MLILRPALPAMSPKPPMGVSTFAEKLVLRPRKAADVGDIDRLSDMVDVLRLAE